MSFVDLMGSLNQVIHPGDALAPVYKAQYELDEYFRSALRQADSLDALTQVHIGKSLADLTAIADYACHYGRLVRALRVAAPKAQIHACDIDAEALAFCKNEFGAQPFYSAWQPDSLTTPPQVDLLVCISLFTHTRKAFFLETLTLWRRMVRPGGLMVFTFLSENFIRLLQAGELAHYGATTPDDVAALVAAFERDGAAFHGYRTPYSATEYGVGFLSQRTVTDAIEAAGDLELLEFRAGPNNEFGQDVAVVRRR